MRELQPCCRGRARSIDLAIGDRRPLQDEPDEYGDCFKSLCAPAKCEYRHSELFKAGRPDCRDFTRAVVSSTDADYQESILGRSMLKAEPGSVRSHSGGSRRR